MDVIMDGLLIAGAVFAGAWCWVLSGRVQALKSLDGGLGGAIVTLTRQIELARATLDEARAASRDSRQDLGQLVARSDAAAAQLRLLLAAIERAEPAARAAAEASAPPAAPPPAPRPVALEPANVDSLVARRRDAPGPRLVPPPEREPEPAETSIFALDPGDADTLPKPRRTLSLDGLLRRRVAPEAAAPAGSEADLLAALTALAAGGER